MSDKISGENPSAGVPIAMSSFEGVVVLSSGLEPVLEEAWPDVAHSKEPEVLGDIFAASAEDIFGLDGMDELAVSLDALAGLLDREKARPNHVSDSATLWRGVMPQLAEFIAPDETKPRVIAQQLAGIGVLTAAAQLYARPDQPRWQGRVKGNTRGPRILHRADAVGSAAISHLLDLTPEDTGSDTLLVRNAIGDRVTSRVVPNKRYVMRKLLESDERAGLSNVATAAELVRIAALINHQLSDDVVRTTQGSEGFAPEMPEDDLEDREHSTGPLRLVGLELSHSDRHKFLELQIRAGDVFAKRGNLFDRKNFEKELRLYHFVHDGQGVILWDMTNGNNQLQKLTEETARHNHLESTLDMAARRAIARLSGARGQTVDSPDFQILTAKRGGRNTLRSYIVPLADFEGEKTFGIVGLVRGKASQSKFYEQIFGQRLANSRIGY